MSTTKAIRLAVTSPGEPEIFYSLQGEGVSYGKPSVFVRLSQCNLHCFWCDTAYTWNFEGTTFEHTEDTPNGQAKFDRGKETVDIESYDLAQKLASFECNRYIVTGGEPLLQQPALQEMLATLKSLKKGAFIEIETNGTIIPRAGLDALIDQYNVSPKLAHSRNQPEVRRQKEALSFFGESSKSNFKFVVSRPGDINEVEEIVQLSGMPRHRVALMPEGTTPMALSDKFGWINQTCLERGFNFTDRLHIHLYGDTRGT